MTIGVILTGMGNDGAKGAQMIRSVGGHVIAQDESTAVIFGMPQEAIKTGAVDQVLPMEAIIRGLKSAFCTFLGRQSWGFVKPLKQLRPQPKAART